MGRKKKKVEDKNPKNINNDEYITITVDNKNEDLDIPSISSSKSTNNNEVKENTNFVKNKEESLFESTIKHGESIPRTARITDELGGRRGKRAKNKKNKEEKVDKHGKKIKKPWSKKKKILMGILFFFLAIILTGVLIFAVYLTKAGGDVKEAVLNVATDIVGEQDPIFVLILGVSKDISVELTDTIMLCGYNPKTQKAFMLSIPRDTFVGKNMESAGGYDKINAKYQKSAQKTVETVELLTGITIDDFVVVRNFSISNIFECIGDIEFDVPINMNYDDPTQDLHIHLKKGKQTLNADQIEQLLRFRHNNDGSSYPASYGNNDYGRMKTQREFMKCVIEQVGTFGSIGKIKDIAAMVYPNLQTSMSGYKVLDYVPYALKFSTSNMKSEQLPGTSAMINELWFYQHSKKETKALVDELLIYLELEDDILESHYKYASHIKGVKPDDEYKSDTSMIEELPKPTYVPKSEVDENGECVHQYVVADEIKATCEHGGTVVYRCLNCMNEYTQSTDKLGHAYKNGKCTRCDKVQEHVCSMDKVSDTATCTASGTATYKCSICGKTETKSSDPKGHVFGSNNPKCSTCGADNPNYKEQENPTPNPEPKPDLTPDPELNPIPDPEPNPNPDPQPTPPDPSSDLT